LIFSEFNDIFKVDMCIQKVDKTINLLVFIGIIAVFLGGCEAIDNLVPSSGAYKINVRIDGVSLDNCSYVRASDKINIGFEEPVSGDPDVTALMVFLKNQAEEVVGWKVLYNIDEEAVRQETARLEENKKKAEEEISSDDLSTRGTSTKDTKEFVFNKNGDELILPVLSLDGELPSFPIPSKLSMGAYTLVLQVMSEKDVLQRTEKNIYYLGRTVFSYEGISVYLPGAAGTPHLIPKESVVMLEANLNLAASLDPYIIWYDGKDKIDEGKYSDGAGYLFWKTPEQNGFYSLYAEVFPAAKSEELIGYKKEISLLVSSNIQNIHLVSKNIEQLTHWYVMEGNLNDSKNPAVSDNALSMDLNKKPKWAGLDGTYGLATGYNNILKLPKVSVLNKNTEIWQTLFRFKPLSNGIVFSVKFGSSADVSIILSIEGKNLVLTLASSQKTVSQTVSFFEESDELAENIQTLAKDVSFLTAGIKFSIQSELLSAQINIIRGSKPVELTMKPILLEAKIKDEFNIALGFSDTHLIEKSESSDNQIKADVSAEDTVLWDEFALYYMPPTDLLTSALKYVTSEDQPVIIAKK
jgi:hypothetical protein